MSEDVQVSAHSGMVVMYETYPDDKVFRETLDESSAAGFAKWVIDTFDYYMGNEDMRKITDGLSSGKVVEVELPVTNMEGIDAVTIYAFKGAE